MKGSSIVLATDLSENARYAAKWAHSFAKKYDLKVIATHVVAISISHWARGAYAVLDDEALMQKARSRVTDWYKDATGDAPDAARVLVGHAPVQLAETVDEHDAAMLVLSVSGKGTLEKFFLGSVAQSLANDPPCPLVLVKPEHSELHEPSDIAVGIDFSKNSGKALDFAAALSKITGGKLDLVHADTTPTIDVIDSEDIPDEYVSDGHYEWAKEEMQQLVDAHQPQLSGVAYQTHIVEDAPAKGMLDYVAEHDPDLVVVGRSGHSRFVASVMGSVVSKVIQSAAATTVVVPADDGQ